MDFQLKASKLKQPEPEYNPSGIYVILNIKNNKVYVGSSIKCWTRWRDHLRTLRSNKHKNKHLQSAWTKYGEENFKFYFIELVEKTEVKLREQFYMDKLKVCIPKYGYNKYPLAESGGRVTSKPEEWRKAQSERMKGNSFAKGNKRTKESIEKQILRMKGKKLSKEHIEKMSLSQKGKPRLYTVGSNNYNAKLKEGQVLNIKNMVVLGFPPIIIAKLLKITQNQVYNVKSGSWKHIKSTINL